MPTEFALSHAAMAMTSIPEDVLRVLEERARQLARPLDGGAVPEITSLLVLQVGPEQYAVDVDAVREIRPLEGITPLPGLPSFWSGLVNLRGNLVPVLELTTYLGLPASEGATDEAKLVFVGAEGIELAFVVDAVREIRHTPAQDLHASAPVEGDGVRIVQHVTKDLVSVLDLSYLLGDPALKVGVDVK